MRIRLRLAWLKAGAAPRRGFAAPEAFALFEGYLGRVGRYAEAGAEGGAPAAREPGVALWAADRAAKPLSSEALAAELGRLAASGARGLDVLIGGPDGHPPGALDALHPELRWGFGPLTLPHELAAVVAAEQLYRAWTILRREPYHLGH